MTPGPGAFAQGTGVLFDRLLLGKQLVQHGPSAVKQAGLRHLGGAVGDGRDFLYRELAFDVQ